MVSAALALAAISLLSMFLSFIVVELVLTTHTTLQKETWKMPTPKVRVRSHHPAIQAGHILTPSHVEPEAAKKEIFASWSLFILITLLITALFTSYILQSKKIQAVHETVISIFAGISLLDVQSVFKDINMAQACSWDFSSASLL